MFPTKSRFWTLCAALAACLCSASLALAQEPQSVSVNFTFKADEFKGVLPAAQTAAMEKDFSERFAKLLAERLPFWNFQANGPAGDPQIAIWLEKSHPAWEIRASLAVPGLPAPRPWKATLFEPGDLERWEGLPGSDDWPDLVSKAFTERLLLEQEEKILSALQDSVPIGTDVALIGPVPPPTAEMARVVLPLEWQKHCGMAKSAFRIVYNWPQNGEVTIHSIGVVLPAKYKPDAPRFDGVIVKLLTFEFAGTPVPMDQHLQHLKELSPKFFYLERAQLNAMSCTAPLDATQPSVAP